MNGIVDPGQSPAPLFVIEYLHGGIIMAKRQDSFQQRLLILAKRLHLAIHKRELPQSEQAFWIKTLKTLQSPCRDQDELLAVVSWFCNNPMNIVRSLDKFYVVFEELVRQYREALRYEVPESYKELALSVLLDFPRMDKRDGCAVFYAVVKWYERLNYSHKWEAVLWNCLIRGAIETSPYITLGINDDFVVAASYLAWVNEQADRYYKWDGKLTWFWPDGGRFLEYLDMLKRGYTNEGLTNDERIYFKMLCV